MQNENAHDAMINNVYDMMQIGFSAFQVLAGTNLKKNWKKIGRIQRGKAMVAVDFIGKISDAPANYFSRAATESDWRFRASEYARANGLTDMSAAFNKVSDPKAVVLERANDAFVTDGELKNDFYWFCDAVQNWEYNRTNPWNYKYKMSYGLMVKNYQDKIIERANKAVYASKIARTSPIFRPIKRMLLNWSSRQH